MLWILFRVNGGEPLGDYGEIRSGFMNRHTRFEMGDYAPVLTEIAPKKFWLIRAAWHPEIDATPGKARRGNADKSAGNAVQGKGLADQGRIGIELANPGGMTQDENRGSARLIVGGLEGASEERGNAEELKRAWGDVIASQPQIAIAGGVDNIIFEVGHQAIKHMVLPHEILKFVKQEGAAPMIGLVLIVESYG